MSRNPLEASLESVVAVARSARPDYGSLAQPVPAPELEIGEARTVALTAVRDLLRIWGLDARRVGAADWNPLGDLIPRGSRILLKPNWVVHENASGQGLDCLVTHTSVIAAILEYVLLTRPASVVIGDAPIQRCDFPRLATACGLHETAEQFRRRGLDVSISDFRRTTLEEAGGKPHRREDVRPAGDYVMFDLGRESLLEPVSNADFRVTMYNPDLLGRTHARGRHRYLIAREVIDADVVINLPKLKSHKKSCITGALKNLIGINGNKEYLPHHRKGGSGNGGDCYPGNSWLKAQAEALLDRSNRAGGRARVGLARLAAACVRAAQLFGNDGNLEGSWFGNDTIWRTCLDLQRILRYGGADGALHETSQRQVITITDAIVGGEGEGPLSPVPVPSGFLSGGLNTAAVEWINSRLMGFDPEKIPLVRQAFSEFPYPLSTFSPDEISVRFEDGPRPAGDIYPFDGRPFMPPAGWQGHCELRYRNDRANCEQTLLA